MLPWPETGNPELGTGPRRVAGAWVLLDAGLPVLYLTAGGRQLLTFPMGLSDPDRAAAAYAALHDIPRATRRRSIVIEKIDGVPARESPHREIMCANGFVSDYRGLAAERFV